MVQIDPLQRLLLWKLATAPDGLWLSELPGHMAKPACRRRLVEAGLVEEEKRRKRTGQRAISATWLSLADAGWAFLGEHLTDPLSRSTYAVDVLQRVLLALRHQLDAHHWVLAEFLSPLLNDDSASEAPEQETAASGSPGATITDLPGGEPTDLATRIREAYRELAQGRSQARVRLAALRDVLCDVPVEQLNAQLHVMEQAGHLVLGRLDDPRQLTPSDEAAKIVTPLGDPRHLIHMEIVSRGSS